MQERPHQLSAATQGSSKRQWVADQGARGCTVTAGAMALCGINPNEAELCSSEALSDPH